MLPLCKADQKPCCHHKATKQQEQGTQNKEIYNMRVYRESGDIQADKLLPESLSSELKPQSPLVTKSQAGIRLQG